MALDLSKIRGEVAATGKDLTKPSAGGGDFAPPQIGPTRLRLVSYIETGIHTTKGVHGDKTKPRSEIGFELSGPRHEPKKLDDGTLIPFRIVVKEIVGTHAKNGYIKLFNTLNVDGTATNFLDLLMDGEWRGNVSHYKFKGRDGSERVIAQLKNKGVYEIYATTFPDPETGEVRKVSVPPAISEPRVFLWDYPDLDQWDSLKIEGVRDDGTSKNYIQEKIKSAENFKGSPIYDLLIEAGREDETIPAAKVEQDDEPTGDGDDQGGPASLEDTPPPAASKPKPGTPGKNGQAPLPKTPPPAAAKAVKPAAKTKPAAAKPAAPDADPLAGV